MLPRKKICLNTRSRIDGVAAYLHDRMTRGEIAAFPAISIGLTHAPDFVPFEEGGAVGTARLSNKGYRILLDGLARVSGTEDLREWGEEGLHFFENSIVFPVTIFCPPSEEVELTVEELGSLFADFNFRVNPVPDRLAIAHDLSDPYIQLTKLFEQEPFIKNYGGMEMKSASLGTKSKAIVVQQVLLRAVRGATEGINYQDHPTKSLPAPNLTFQTLQRERASLAEFFNEISGRMGKDRWGARDSMHLTSVVWQSFGIIHHDLRHRGLTFTPLELDRIYELIARVDWSRGNPLWLEMKLGEWVINKRNERVFSTRKGGYATKMAILDYLRKITGLDQKLASLTSVPALDPLSEQVSRLQLV